MTTFEITRDLILLGLALFGAGLSVFNFFHARERERRKVRVCMNTVTPAYDDGTVGRPHARIEATNIGHRDVTVTNIYIELPNGGKMFAMTRDGLPGVRDTALPITLSDGDVAYFHAAYVDLAEALLSSGRDESLPLTPVAEDTSGGIHRGKPWKISAAELFSIGQPITPQ